MKRKNLISIAALIENRDSSTGEHVRRISRYVELIANEMKIRGYYKDILTERYIKNLVKFAPLHDIGKIFVPDAILTKPERLTAQEFEIMKRHTEIGGEIIHNFLAAFIGKEYCDMAYEIAMYHHEKWNGRGYPRGLEQEEIPLCARIVSVADVFDAVSEDRCYRKAMPLEECFRIIERGAGEDFDPLAAKTFIEMREKVKKVHKKFSDKISGS